jgi:hypothetical protein
MCKNHFSLSTYVCMYVGGGGEAAKTCVGIDTCMVLFFFFKDGPLSMVTSLSSHL